MPEKRELVIPAVVLAPLVGFDDRSYRLGYGGGYFDRTLASLAPRPFAIGVGFEPQADRDYPSAVFRHTDGCDRDREWSSAPLSGNS